MSGRGELPVSDTQAIRQRRPAEPRSVRLRLFLSLLHEREKRGTYPPTVRELGLAMGLHTPDSAYYWVLMAERLGYAQRGGARIARSIHTTAAGRAFIEGVP